MCTIMLNCPNCAYKIYRQIIGNLDIQYQNVCRSNKHMAQIFM
jgi:hypothetical protein